MSPQSWGSGTKLGVFVASDVNKARAVKAKAKAKAKDKS